MYDDFLHQCRPGPWGELQYSRIVIEPPDEFTATDYVARPEPIWFFRGYDEPKLAALWTAAGLPPAEIAALSLSSAIEVGPDYRRIRPGTTLVVSLSPAARATIYSALSLFPENTSQAEPFRFRADSADEWFENSNLPADTLAQVKRLLYRRGTSLLFSDQDIVLSRINSRGERIELIKTLARKSSLLVKLLVKPESDLDTLSAYWGHGVRRKAIRPFLESLSHRSRGITVDIVHLLPRFARAHVFTYPQTSDHPGDLNHDCHWSSLNFFNDPPDERFADEANVKHTLETEYYVPGSGPPLLGDVLAFERPDGAVIHSCVYVADDIVFTKNGSAAVMPWILMNLPDVLAFYPADVPLKVRAYRRKDL
jgi:hypothetical protein